MTILGNGVSIHRIEAQQSLYDCIHSIKLTCLANTGVKHRANEDVCIFELLHADSVYWSCMGFPNNFSTHVFRVAARTGAPLVVAVLGTTGREIA